jgi:excisionase family DNA binding protein
MMRPDNASVEALTIEETAEVLRVSRRHLHKLMADGNGPPVVRLGRRKIIRREALQQWLLNQEITTP